MMKDKGAEVLIRGGGAGENTALQGEQRRRADSLVDCGKPHSVSPSPTSALKPEHTAGKATQPGCREDGNTGRTRGRHGHAWSRHSTLNSFLAACLKFSLLFFIVGNLVICVGAVPVPVSLHVEGQGRPLQGESYSLVCEVSPVLPAHTSAAFVWYRDGKLLDQETEQELKLRPLTKSDEGDYKCGLHTGDMEGVQSSNPYPLHVIVFEKISLVPEVEVEEGQTVILNCSVHSDPTAHLTWRLGGKTVQTKWSNSDSLVLHNASQYHLQIVLCQAYNQALILGFLDAYSLIRRKGTYEVMSRPHLGQRGFPVLHSPFGLECLVMEFPNQGVNVHLTYTWYKDHKEIEGQSDMILDFPSLSREDRGRYTCTARNGKPRTTSLESNAWEVVVLVPPEVHMEPPDKVISWAAGDTLTLTCNVTEAFPGVAAEGYRWSYLPSPGGQLRPLEGRESTLTLGPLTREDSGQYICQAWNFEDFGGLLPPGNAFVTVDVMYVENIRLTPALEVNEGHHVTLTCSVDSKPAARLSWLVEGREVRHVTANVDHYVLERAACSDNKTYTCRASIPHLPGLELNTSTEILVNCTDYVSPSLPPMEGSTLFSEGANKTAVPIPVSLIAGVTVSSLAVVGVSVFIAWWCYFARTSRCKIICFVNRKQAKQTNGYLENSSHSSNSTEEESQNLQFLKSNESGKDGEGHSLSKSHPLLDHADMVM